VQAFPLDLVPVGLVVSLGVVHVSTPELEDSKLQRVEMTARYFWGNDL
jgi:hypothetical protein